MNTDPHYVARCVLCETSFTGVELSGKSRCPKCGTTNLPCDPAQDVTIKINTHELRILGIWAENWAAHVDNQHLDDAYHAPLKEVVAAITTRLESQLSGMGKQVPLTLASEVKEMKSKNIDVELYRDGKEEPI